MSAVHSEVLLAAGYSLFLLAAAVGVERLARHSHTRSERFRTAGFTYHGHLDSWLCPEGQHLRRHETDHERRLVRYRGKAHICNACQRKDDCTDSDEGREIVHPLDPWPHSEAGRFHRGICLVLVALAGLILAVGALRHHDPEELAIVAPLAALVATAAGRMAVVFRSSPANFPARGVPVARR